MNLYYMATDSKCLKSRTLAICTKKYPLNRTVMLKRPKGIYELTERDMYSF